LETYSLFQLNEYIKRVIALNFQDAVWINAEISQVKLSRSNYYLDLIEKEENTEVVKAKASAIIWYRKVSFLEKKFKSLFHSILDTGNEIRVKVSINFSERYGFSLVIEDLDASYTLGKAEMLKQEILDRLKKENLIYLNAQLDLPDVLQNIAVISSATAAGYKDFTSHLESNSYGYKFNVKLYSAAMQGQAVENEILAALEQIQHEGPFDCVAIIRGGGAKLDLSAFDNYNIAKKIATSQLPIITGIGHDIDQSIADLVSHTDLKTPTAVADFIIETNLHFESRLMDIGHQIEMTYREIIQTNTGKLALLNEQLANTFVRIRDQEGRKLSEIKLSLKHLTSAQLTRQGQLLDSFGKQLTLLSPENALKRGYSILRQGGKVVKSIKDIDLNKKLETQLVDGKLISKIESDGI
jgi:exodeoxyribonuclease VII large subunit